ncbi:MAG: RNA polymerase factor sigma-54 [Bacteroidota bacterium]|nr:RNA polymerase factor sigma-54 [Bacteroidota bacterium]MDP4206958.1 RNA polymerase factor sigma-54 [Bacteroidota bacterium]
MQKLTLQQKLLQKLSPQQIQVIKLLEIPTMELEQRIKEELEVNPVLEVTEEIANPDDNSNEDDDFDANELKSNEDKDNEEFSVEDYLEDDEVPNYRLNDNNYSKDDKFVEVPYSVDSSFHEFLIEQLGLIPLDERQYMLAEYIIGNIDEDGYLRRDLEAILDDVAFAHNIEATEKEMYQLLWEIQDFDPAGVGARNLRECLLLQLKRKDKSRPSIKTAQEILRDSFEEFTKKHFTKIQDKFNLTDAQMKEAINEILKLNPKPGSPYSNQVSMGNQEIIPDFTLEVEDGELKLSLNQRNVPSLQINDDYLNMLKAYSENRKGQSKDQKEALMFVKQKIDSAKWFIDAIRQRQQTLLLTMSEIINFQRAYFMEGDETKLRPMILKDIADLTGLDISTISRVSNSKYIQTHFGIFPLKYFFSEGMQKDNGEEVSTREIKMILQECIAGENKRTPLTDDELAQILQGKSYPIARRTVAKYREQLGIPVARLRKEL